MKLQLRADDKMPWGLHKEMTLRQIYREDREYYEYILTLDTIHISRETQTLLKSQKGRSDITPLEYQCEKENLSYNELRVESVFYSQHEL